MTRILINVKISDIIFYVIIYFFINIFKIKNQYS